VRLPRALLLRLAPLEVIDSSIIAYFQRIVEVLHGFLSGSIGQEAASLLLLYLYLLLFLMECCKAAEVRIGHVARRGVLLGILNGRMEWMLAQVEEVRRMCLGSSVGNRRAILGSNLASCRLRVLGRYLKVLSERVR